MALRLGMAARQTRAQGWDALAKCAGPAMVEASGLGVPETHSRGPNLRRGSAKSLLVDHETWVDQGASVPAPLAVHAVCLPYFVRVVFVDEEAPVGVRGAHVSDALHAPCRTVGTRRATLTEAERCP